MTQSPERCHCGLLAVVSEGLGRSRAMCEPCDLARCDLADSDCPNQAILPYGVGDSTWIARADAWPPAVMAAVLEERSKIMAQVWDDCIREVFLSAARGPVFDPNHGEVRELPANPYRRGTPEADRAWHRDALHAVMAAAWQRGKEAAEASVNPYEISDKAVVL